jgi:hypothetical protein
MSEKIESHNGRNTMRGMMSQDIGNGRGHTERNITMMRLISEDMAFVPRDRRDLPQS